MAAQSSTLRALPGVGVCREVLDWSISQGMDETVRSARGIGVRIGAVGPEGASLDVVVGRELLFDAGSKASIRVVIVDELHTGGVFGRIDEERKEIELSNGRGASKSDGEEPGVRGIATDFGTEKKGDVENVGGMDGKKRGNGIRTGGFGRLVVVGGEPVATHGDEGAARAFDLELGGTLEHILCELVDGAGDAVDFLDVNFETASKTEPGV